MLSGIHNMSCYSVHRLFSGCWLLVVPLRGNEVDLDLDLEVQSDSERCP